MSPRIRAPMTDTSPILSGLNDAQRAAVCAPVGPVLVLAGAGSGKTRVLTHRIAWVIQTEGASPHSILAVTFTNKAAHEMRGRIEKLLGVPGGAMWVGTFHGIAHRLLRLHWRDANLPQSFQILDGEDQLRLIKKIVKAMELDETRWVPREIQWFINGNKDEGSPPGDDEGCRRPDAPPAHQDLHGIRSAMPARGRRGFRGTAAARVRAVARPPGDPGALPAALPSRADRRVPGHERIQYAWALLVAGQDGAPFVVGDDDQSIYRWRGARVENLTRYTRDYPAAKMFRLEQNYRSTGNILKAANALIANNTGRLGKNLWTAGHGRRAHPALRRFQRARRGRVRDEPHPRLDEPGRRAARRRDPLSLERAVARVRRSVPVRAHSLQGVRRPAILRARGNQGRAGVPAPHHEPRRRRIVRARGEPADARHRREVARRDPRTGEGGGHFAVDAAAHCIANGVLGPKAESGGERLPEAHRAAGARHPGPRAARAGRPRHQQLRPRSSTTRKRRPIAARRASKT